MNHRQCTKLLWSTNEVAAVLGWTPRRARRWLLRERAATKHGRYYYSTSAQIRQVFREAADDMIVRMSLSE